MAAPVAFFALFFAWPVVSIVERGLRVDGAWQFGRFGETLSRPEILDVLWFTCWQALASTGLTLLIALPGAYVFARFDFPGKGLLRAVVTVPFVMPTVMVGTAFLALVGRGGLLDGLWGVRLDTTVWAILIAHVFFNYAVVVRTVGGLWAQLDPRQEEAARVLGASRWRAWRTVTLPALAPSVAAAALMVFLFTASSFAVVQILGGSTYSTLETEIDLLHQLLACRRVGGDGALREEIVGEHRAGGVLPGRAGLEARRGGLRGAGRGEQVGDDGAGHDRARRVRADQGFRHGERVVVAAGDDDEAVAEDAGEDLELGVAGGPADRLHGELAVAVGGGAEDHAHVVGGVPAEGGGAGDRALVGLAGEHRVHHE